MSSESSFPKWVPQVRVSQAQTRTFFWVFQIGAGAQDLGLPLLLSQAYQQGARFKVEQQGFKCLYRMPTLNELA